ncbi:helix-turn-helix domain-containing protein [Streptomyces sp. NPDC020951]|uniref:helix-turn-helix domain-containing protein n=1 Tax=Streptomyces sp. NPDC020951 TaxID=3365104 RepID=UPI0037B111F5
MLGTVFRTDDVPAEGRLDLWRDLLTTTRSPSEITSPHAADFWAEYHLMELGPVTVWPTSYQPSRFRRNQRLVRRSDPERYHLTLLIQGGLAVEHIGRANTFGPRDLLMTDSSRPYDVLPHGAPSYDDRDRQVVQGVGVDFPKALLSVPPHLVRDLLCRRLPGQDGVGALLTDFLVGLDRQSQHLGPSDAPRLGRIVLDLVSAWLAHLLETEDALDPETRHRVTVERIRAFIRQNLHDPTLTPTMIAAAHHISLSYLHRIFQQRTQGDTVAAWIRDQRLAGARRDLADPALRATSIHTVAARWGMPRASDFTRAFRTAYGVSPREYRLRAASERQQEQEQEQGAEHEREPRREPGR